MTQPKYAPILLEDEVRPANKLEVPRPWRPHRPSELRPLSQPPINGGAPGPDQGYALRLAELIAPRVVLGPGEHLEDVMAAAVAVGLRRAASFGRAPVALDVEFGLNALGALSELDGASQERRRLLLLGLSHDYFRQRELADGVSPESFRASAASTGPFLLDAAADTAV